MKKILLIGLFLCFLSVPAYAQSTLALQEKCSEEAKKFERERFELGLHNSDISFENHYNKKLDKCFVRIGYYFGIEKGEDGEGYASYGFALYNVFESSKPIGELRYFGDYNVRICYVGNKRCKTIDEFEALIKPYMEE